MAEVETQKYLIVDTDMGPDDAWALLMLLKAEKCFQNIKILAITCVNGNTTMSNVIKNTYHLLRSRNRHDIPIHRGAATAIVSQPVNLDPFFGENGMADVDFWRHDIYPTDENDLVHEKNAVEIIRDLVLQHPNKITIICLGPLTNVALAVRAYPEIANKVKELFIMGGNFKAVGNVTICAEFNFYIDPEAAHIVLGTFKCPMTLLPLETCFDGLCITKEWRLETLKNVNCEILEQIIKAEIITSDKYIYNSICDAYLAAAFLFPEKCIRKMKNKHVSVELHGFHTRGQMVVNHKEKNDHNVTIIKLLDGNEIQEALLWLANA